MVNWKQLRKKIPAKVQIGRNTFYSILWREKKPENPHYGYTDYSKRQIEIELNNSPKETICTYVHELLHAFSEESGANLTETQILALEKTVYYWLKSDNIFKK